MTAALAPLLEAHRARSSTPPDAKGRVGSSDHRGEAAASSAKENTPLQPADDVVDTWGGSARMGCSSRSAAAGPMPTSAADAVRQRSWADMAGSWRPPERLGGTGEASAGGGGSAKKAPRKGGLSLFLSGVPPVLACVSPGQSGTAASISPAQPGGCCICLLSCLSLLASIRSMRRISRVHTCT